MRLFVICLLLLPFCFQHAKAETTVPGSNCHSITPSQANLMEWREQGLKNASSTDYWINCPFERNTGVAETELTVRAANETDGPLSLSCSFREIFGGVQKQSRSASAEINGGGYANLSVNFLPKERDSVMNATCKITKGILIEATKVDFSQACSNSSLVGYWTYGFSYGYDGFELGVAELDVNGNIDAEVLDESGSIAAMTGSYEVAEGCGMDAELYSRGVKIIAIGVISEDRKTIQGVAQNSLGYFSNVTLTRVGLEESAQRSGMLRALAQDGGD